MLCQHLNYDFEILGYRGKGKEEGLLKCKLEWLRRGKERAAGLGDKSSVKRGYRHGMRNEESLRFLVGGQEKIEAKRSTT